MNDKDLPKGLKVCKPEIQLCNTQSALQKEKRGSYSTGLAKK